jgi:hypothetical protein
MAPVVTRRVHHDQWLHLGARDPSAPAQRTFAALARHARADLAVFRDAHNGPIPQMAVQAGFLILSACLFFGVYWGDPFGLFLITGVLICFGVSLVLFMGTVFRNPRQPVSLGPWIGVLLGMLGGCMWPLKIVPPFM